MSQKIICPACGSSNIEKKEQEQTKQLTLGPEFAFVEINYSCKDCQEEGDFAGENEGRYGAALKAAQAESTKGLIESLSTNSISMAYFERVFELPFRTMHRWKNGDLTSSALALLRTVKTYPWIAEVAEGKFDTKIATSILAREGLKAIGNLVNSSPNTTLEVELVNDSTSIAATATMRVHKNQSTGPKLAVGTSGATGG